MYKVIVIDDELIERQGVKFLLERYNGLFDITVLDTGKEVLDCLEKEAYDILFTDIKMPIMDGLELSKRAMLIQPDLNIVIISAYGEFPYAKQAINIGVSEYILKPIHIDEFNKVVDKIIVSLKERDSQRKYEKNYYLLTLLNGIDKMLTKNKKAIDFKYFNQYTRMMLIETNTNFFEMAEEDFAHKLKETLREEHDYLNINQYQSLLFFLNYYPNNEEFEELGERIYREVIKAGAPSAVIVLSRELHGYTELYGEYSSFDELLETRFYLGNVNVISHASIEMAKPEMISELIRNINYYGEKKDAYSLRQCVLYFCKQYRYTLGFSKIYMNYIFSEILKAVYSNIKGDYQQEFEEQILKIYQCENHDEIMDIMEQSIEKLESNDNEVQNDGIIYTVIQYIKENYREDITLEMLANKVYLTPSYLSHIFRKRTGNTIMQFIKQCRMEKAKELLVTTNMKVVDISNDIGYANCSYFCHNFSINYGMSPEKYRQRYLL